MTVQLHIPLISVGSYVIYGWNETENRIKWQEGSYFDRQCRFWCHKCTGAFREEFVKETNYMPLHVDHCRYKRYDIGWHPNNASLNAMDNFEDDLDFDKDDPSKFIKNHSYDTSQELSQRAQTKLDAQQKNATKLSEKTGRPEPSA